MPIPVLGDRSNDPGEHFFLVRAHGNRQPDACEIVIGEIDETGNDSCVSFCSHQKPPGPNIAGRRAPSSHNMKLRTSEIGVLTSRRDALKLEVVQEGAESVRQLAGVAGTG
jgi:hypothetical protein